MVQKNLKKETLNILKTFYIISGLKINVKKTRAIWIGSLSNSNRQLYKEYKLDWSQGPFKILGVMFTAEVFNICDVNTEQIYKNIENICKQWSKKINFIRKNNHYESIGFSKIYSFVFSTT